MEIMHGWAQRVVYLVCGAVVVALGIGSRRYGGYLPAFVAQYAGDTLWALMVFLGFSVVVPGWSTTRRAALALVVCYAMELSQLYHAPWIHALRHTTLGGLVLGFGFLWSDLVCYAVGVVVGAACDFLFHRSVGSRCWVAANPTTTSHPSA